MVIKTVFPNSIASSIGLKSGDRLLKINNRKVLDEIDYQFRFSSDLITISVEMNGVLESFEIEKEYDDLLGVAFEDMKIRSCANDCVFCFV
jgi:NifB/MoaA-like Fe-S oxidoreductase